MIFLPPPPGQARLHCRRRPAPSPLAAGRGGSVSPSLANWQLPTPCSDDPMAGGPAVCVGGADSSAVLPLTGDSEEGGPTAAADGSENPTPQPPPAAAESVAGGAARACCASGLTPLRRCYSSMTERRRRREDPLLQPTAARTRNSARNFLQSMRSETTG